MVGRISLQLIDVYAIHHEMSNMISANVDIFAQAKL